MKFVNHVNQNHYIAFLDCPNRDEFKEVFCGFAFIIIRITKLQYLGQVRARQLPLLRGRLRSLPQESRTIRFHNQGRIWHTERVAVVNH